MILRTSWLSMTYRRFNVSLPAPFIIRYGLKEVNMKKMSYEFSCWTSFVSKRVSEDLPPHFNERYEGNIQNIEKNLPTKFFHQDRIQDWSDIYEYGNWSYYTQSCSSFILKLKWRKEQMFHSIFRFFVLFLVSYSEPRKKPNLHSCHS